MSLGFKHLTLHVPGTWIYSTLYPSDIYIWPSMSWDIPYTLFILQVSHLRFSHISEPNKDMFYIAVRSLISAPTFKHSTLSTNTGSMFSQLQSPRMSPVTSPDMVWVGNNYIYQKRISVSSITLIFAIPRIAKFITHVILAWSELTLFPVEVFWINWDYKISVSNIT